jgi:hypothetical protein
MTSGNSPFSSGSSVSSLLKNAQSQYQKIQDFNDAMAAYEWDNSVKTYADYIAYSNYLESQSNGTTDPMSQLTYQKKLNTTRSGYISNEIQRQSIDVIEGASSNADKYNKMADLYYQAAGAGQFDLAQNLHLQLDNLSVTIQNEQKAAMAANREASSSLAKSIDIQVQDAVTQIKDNAQYALEQYQALGPSKFQESTGSDIFSMLSNMINSQDPNAPGLVQVYDQAASASPDAGKVRSYQVSLNNLANGGETGIELPGAGKITYKDLQDQVYAQSIGETLFQEQTTGEGTVFSKNQTTGYAWGRDENGEYKLMPIYNPSQKATSNVSQDGKQLSYNDLLTNASANKAGFEVVSNKNGNIVVRNNGAFDSAGIPRGGNAQLYVDKNGGLQLVNGDKAYTLGFDQKTGKYTGLNANAPNPINLLPNSDQFNSRYFATQDLSNVAAGTIGLVDTTSAIARSMEAGPLGLPQPNIQQSQAQAPRPVAPNAVQQGAINPIGLPASTTINIAKPQPLPTITIAKPQPLPKITVTQAKPQPKLSVGKPSSNPRIVF